MENKYKLTIAVITMNRSEQLTEALESCISCKLPSDIEFVIVDNASTDNTKNSVESFFEKHPGIPYIYRYSDTNLGVGGGRSLAFELAHGQYVYFLDDDAVISEECRNTFFFDTLNYLDKNTSVASLTTRIYDEMWKCDRKPEISNKIKIDELPIMLKFLGGSHFLRRECFDKPLNFNIKYGCEEYAPSIKVQNRNFYHVFDHHIYIIHKPKVNKWKDGTSDMEYVECCGCAARYATKKILYPCIFYPVLWLGYMRRAQKYLKNYPGAKKKTAAMVKEIIRENNAEKVSVACVIRFVKEFGLTVL